ncbi:hypothetical protein MA16_Dca015637 [Dendrobium catenatum]|uniref:Uncharacterized protein n=1 Tax=Dendrobium catenatum TaxID=906689 RepID=A0A2I0VXK4_9ASPA|nr:hypothetical protein MA16_Dca015637 [Dendrobium catenatum]
MQTIAATEVAHKGKSNRNNAATNNQRPHLPLPQDLPLEAAGTSGLSRNRLKELPGSPSSIASTESETYSDSETEL